MDKIYIRLSHFFIWFPFMSHKINILFDLNDIEHGGKFHLSQTHK